MRSQLKEYLVTFFILGTRNEVKDFDEKGFLEITETLMEHYGEPVCMEVMSVPSDPIQAAAQNLWLLWTNRHQ
jgi:hypothetical protein